MIFDTVMSDIFDRGVSRGKLGLEEEREAIRAAKQGDEEATVKLMYAYAYALRQSTAQFRYAGGIWAGEAKDAHRAEDLRSGAILGFMEALQSVDLDVYSRLSAVLRDKLAENLASSVLSQTVGFHVPQRTLTRFYGILRNAGGNVYEAAAIAPQYNMNRETFLAVLSAVRDVASYDGLTSAEDEHGQTTQGGQSADGSRDVIAYSLSGNEGPDVEDRILVEAAFRAVDDLEETVVRDYYGFTEYNTMSDAEIAQRRNLSRPKVQRVRASALGKMRDALGA